MSEINNSLREKLKNNVKIISNISDYYTNAKEKINKNYQTFIEYGLEDEVEIFNKLLFETDQVINWSIEAYVEYMNEDIEETNLYELLIIPGVGGNDTEDLSDLLFDLYLKYVRKNSNILAVDAKRRIFYFDSNEIFKKISLTENCMYKIIRISPYCDKKQTSFIQVCIKPIVKTVNFSIKEEDLHIESTKSSGPGGQHVNKTESAIRAKHKPTGIIVFISESRSQQQNKKLAIEILTRKVYESFAVKKEDEKKKKYKDTWKISWGNSYSRIFNQHKECYLKNRDIGLTYQNIKNISDISLDLVMYDQFIFLITKKE